jgi:hypothetical protein
MSKTICIEDWISKIQIIFEEHSLPHQMAIYCHKKCLDGSASLDDDKLNYAGFYASPPLDGRQNKLLSFFQKKKGLVTLGGFKSTTASFKQICSTWSTSLRRWRMVCEALMSLIIAMMNEEEAVASAPVASHPEVVAPVAFHPEIVAPVASRPEVFAPVASHPEVVPLVPTHPEVVPLVPSHPEVVPLVASHPEVVAPVPSHPEVVPLVASHPEVVATVPSDAEIIAMAPSTASGL